MKSKASDWEENWARLLAAIFHSFAQNHATLLQNNANSILIRIINVTLGN